MRVLLECFVEWVEKRPPWLVFSLWILVVVPFGITEEILQNITEKIYPKEVPMKGIKLWLFTFAPLLHPVVLSALGVMMGCGVWGLVSEGLRRKHV